MMTVRRIFSGAVMVLFLANSHAVYAQRATDYSDFFGEPLLLSADQFEFLASELPRALEGGDTFFAALQAIPVAQFNTLVVPNQSPEDGQIEWLRDDFELAEDDVIIFIDQNEALEAAFFSFDESKSVNAELIEDWVDSVISNGEFPEDFGPVDEEQLRATVGVLGFIAERRHYITYTRDLELPMRAQAAAAVVDNADIGAKWCMPPWIRCG